jgi:plasmid stabilization system protein ParE
MKQTEAIDALCDLASTCAGVLHSEPRAGSVHSKIIKTIREHATGKLSAAQAARLARKWRGELDQIREAAYVEHNARELAKLGAVTRAARKAGFGGRSR